MENTGRWIVLPATPASVSVARRLAVEQISAREVDASQHAVVALCVSELVSNVVRHAYPGGRVGDVRMLVCIDDGSVQLVVVDHGVGFQDADTPGVGMGIVESLCESVVWERFEDGSTCVFARLAASGGPNSGFDQPQSVGYGAR